MRKRLLAIILVLVTVPGAALAYGVQSGSAVTLSKGDTKTGTYYVAGQTITIDGDVNGDLMCAGSNVTINGAVHGDVICAGQILSVNGPVDGSVRLAGQAITLAGTVGRNVTVATQNLTLSASARVGGDLGILGQTANINGPVDKDIYGAVEYMTLAAAVGGVDAQLRGLSLSDRAKVAGNLKYTSDQTFEVDRAKVEGEIIRMVPAVSQAQRDDDAARDSFALRLYWILAGLAAALTLVGLAPRLASKVAQTMQERPGGSLGLGLLVTLLTPILLVLLMISLIGIPLGILGGLAYGLLLLASGLFAGLTVGRWLLTKADWQKDSLLWAAVLGLPITVIALSVPVLGGFLTLVVTCWGVGGVALSVRSLR